jgi:hypothetical protein
MTIFDYLTQVFVKKQTDISLEGYVPYMINRWLSFVNPTVSETINHFNSKNLLENKDLHYKVMLASFPKLKAVPRIAYEKKGSNKTVDKEINLNKAVAQTMELSEREVIQLKEFSLSIK